MLFITTSTIYSTLLPVLSALGFLTATFIFTVCARKENALLHISRQTTKSQPLRVKFADNNAKQFGSNPAKFCQTILKTDDPETLV